MPDEVRILLVQREELPIVVKMGRQTFIDNYAHLNDPDNFQNYINEAFAPDQWYLEWLDPHARFFIAWLNDEPVGYIKVNLHHGKKGLEGDQHTELERIYVIATAQKSGIGRQLLAKAIEMAKSTASEYLWLGVWQDNPKAIEWYKRQGFEQFGEHTFKLGVEDQKDWLMRLKVGGH